jgi:hypothetical protein
MAIRLHPMLSANSSANSPMQPPAAIRCGLAGEPGTPHAGRRAGVRRSGPLSGPWPDNQAKGTNFTKILAGLRSVLGVILLALAGCSESHKPIEVPEHPAPKPTSPPHSMSAPVEVKPRPLDRTRNSGTLLGQKPEGGSA